MIVINYNNETHLYRNGVQMGFVQEKADDFCLFTPFGDTEYSMGRFRISAKELGSTVTVEQTICPHPIALGDDGNQPDQAIWLPVDLSQPIADVMSPVSMFRIKMTGAGNSQVYMMYV